MPLIFLGPLFLFTLFGEAAEARPFELAAAQGASEFDLAFGEADDFPVA
jgi:hypothetical protein